jgi:hypothetical protein
MLKMQIGRLIMLAILVNCPFDASGHSGSMLFKDPQKPEYVLFTGMKTDYTIFVSIAASESEIWAARELQHWLMEISRAYFPILEYAEEFYGGRFSGRPGIYVGFSDLKIEGPEPEYDDESFRYFNTGPDIYIYGGKLRGTMYGVMSFLENEFGCRWYTPTVSNIPPRKGYAFTSFDHSESPGVQVRNSFFHLAFDPVWAARNKMNGRHSSGVPVKVQPGGVESYWRVHTFHYLVLPDEFFDDHPEYYCLVDGERTHHRAHLCLSNPDVLGVLTDRLRKVMREDPEHLIYSVSQSDGAPNTCGCDQCQAIVQKYGGEESGIVVWFVNQVAESIEDEFPDKYIGTLAYRHTRTAPQGIKPVTMW